MVTRTRHSWIGWDGRLPKVKAKCVTCGLIRENYGTGTSYYLDGILQQSNPSCKLVVEPLAVTISRI